LTEPAVDASGGLEYDERQSRPVTARLTFTGRLLGSARSRLVIEESTMLTRLGRARAAFLLTACALLAASIVARQTTVGAANPNHTLYLPVIDNPCPSTPILTSPANGATLTTLVPYFTWTAAAIGGQSTFEVDISTSSSFSPDYDYLNVDSDPSSPCLGQIRNPGNLTPRTTYYWRVSVETDNSFGPYSAVGSFTTLNVNSSQLLPPPGITSPTNNLKNVPTSPTFQWQAVTGATDYLVLWEPSGTTSFSFEYTNGLQLKPAVLLAPGTTYDLYVATLNDSGLSDPWATVSFTTSGTASPAAISRALGPGEAHGVGSLRGLPRQGAPR